MKEIDKDDPLMFPCEIGRNGITKLANQLACITDLAKAPVNLGKTFSAPMPQGSKLITKTGLTDKANGNVLFLVEAHVNIVQRLPISFEITELSVHLPHIRDMKLTVIDGFNCSPLKFKAQIDHFAVVSEPWMSKLVSSAHATVNANLWAACTKHIEEAWPKLTDEILSNMPISVRPVVRSYISKMGLSRHEELDKLREFVGHFGPTFRSLLKEYPRPALGLF